MKPKKEWLYSNKLKHHQCPVMCDENGKIIKFKYLTKKKPPSGVYIYVIRESEPERIYIHPDSEPAYNCETGKVETVHHNCLAQEQNIICGGDIEFYEDVHGIETRIVKVSNASGHYYPHEDCLEYVTQLLTKMRYYVIDYYSF